MNDTDITYLVDTLDAADEPWNLWRAAGGKWIVQRGEGRTDPASRTLEGSTLPEVLQLAVDSKRLPMIPRKPELRHYNLEKRAGALPWNLLCSGHSFRIIKRKSDAKIALEQCQIQQRENIDAWIDEHFLFTSTHTAGVDFYWVDR